METLTKREIYFSFFMFTADLRPDNTNYTKILISHLKALTDMGYEGFDVHIASPAPNVDHSREFASYVDLKRAFDAAGLKHTKFVTNVGTTRTFDPTSPYKEQREQALSYLKSRINITSILGGESIMSGPFLYPYGAFPATDLGEQLWSDALQAWMKPRYLAARSVFQELAAYAETKAVKLAIEPVKNWETPPPNMVSEILDFLDTVDASQCGVTIDTAQVLMESQGPAAFKQNVDRALKENRLYYVHVSAPDRGALRDSWIPWEVMLGKLVPVFPGPYLIEVFNAIPPFDSLMRMTRPRFWRPNEDGPVPGQDSAYDIARAALQELQDRIAQFETKDPTSPSRASE